MSQMKRIYDIYYVFRREFYTVFRDHAVIVFFVLLTLAYPLVYTYIYSDEVVRDVPVAVVDHSNSSLSREFIRDWGASPNVRIVAHCSDLEQAKILMHEKKIYGILEVPSDFSKSVARGDQAHVALFCDMGALLNYKALLQAASDVAIGMSREIQVEGLPYASRIQQEITTSPVEIAEVKMFNPQSGFASFIIPAVLVLVIQQSLLLGKALLYIPIYFVMGYWVFFIVPRIFGLTQIGNRGDLMLFLFPFLLACAFLAIFASFLSKEREQPFLLFVFTSVPLMFISGISWPREGIPSYWITLSKIFPSTHGIDGFVKINNMGARLADVNAEFISLWILAAVYFVLACALYYREIRKVKAGKVG